jgi:hypothetical protein
MVSKRFWLKHRLAAGAPGDGLASESLVTIDLHPCSDVTEGMCYQPLADFRTPANAEAHGCTLTRPNCDAMANPLLPRAVADASDVQYRPVHCGPTRRDDELPATDGCARSLV